MAADSADPNLNATRLAHFANGMLGVTDQIQENLNQLVRIADNRRQIGLRLKIHMNIVAAQRMILKLKGALDQRVDVERLFLRSSGPRGGPASTTPDSGVPAGYASSRPP